MTNNSEFNFFHKQCSQFSIDWRKPRWRWYCDGREIRNKKKKMRTSEEYEKNNKQVRMGEERKKTRKFVFHHQWHYNISSLILHFSLFTSVLRFQFSSQWTINCCVTSSLSDSWAPLFDSIQPFSIEYFACFSVFVSFNCVMFSWNLKLFLFPPFMLHNGYLYRENCYVLMGMEIRIVNIFTVGGNRAEEKKIAIEAFFCLFFELHRIGICRRDCGI